MMNEQMLQEVRREALDALIESAESDVDSVYSSLCP